MFIISPAIEGRSLSFMREYHINIGRWLDNAVLGRFWYVKVEVDILDSYTDKPRITGPKTDERTVNESPHSLNGSYASEPKVATAD